MITINLSEPQAINFGATGSEEIVQNVRTIVTTALGSVPIERGFGIDYSVLDDPLPVLRAKLSSLIVAAIRLYEPRADVVRIEFQDDHNAGKTVPIITISEVNT
jgi:phage baseplate assembly protein W